ncbi:MAG TPA: hypothetical protein VG452_09475 [Egibacteraceae bacterium]|nr:hypothetical protein [Egibacteraceae bacterium]
MRPASLAVTLVVALCAGVFAFSGSSYADVTAVQGGASGYFTRVSLFGGPPAPAGRRPR